MPGSDVAAVAREPDISAKDYASFLLPLLLDSPTWIRRRVETVAIEDDEAISVRVSADFDLRLTETGREYQSLIAEGLISTLMVPLGLFGKRPLVGFELKDAAGKAVSLVTRAEAADIAKEIVYASVLQHVSKAKAAPVMKHLDAVVDARSPEDGARLLEGLPAVVANQQEAATIETLLASASFGYLIRSFATKFLVLAALPPETGGRRILKYSYMTDLAWERPFRRLALMGRLGLRPIRMTFSIPLLRLSGSYHVEIEAPETTEIRYVCIEQERADKSRRCVAEQSGKLARVHLYTPERIYYDNSSSWLTLAVGPQRRGLLRQSLASCSLAAFALLVVAVFHKRIANGDAGATGPLLLIIPGLIASYISRPTEHPVASRLFFGVRLITAAVGFLSYVAAALVTLQVKEVTLNRSGYVLFVLAAFGTVLVLAANAAASRRPRWWRGG